MTKTYAREEILKMVDALTTLLGQELIEAQMKQLPRHKDIVDAIMSLKYLLDVYYQPAPTPN